MEEGYKYAIEEPQEPITLPGVQIQGNGRHSPMEGLRARVIGASASLTVQIETADGDYLHEMNYTLAGRVPLGDPEGRARSVGQRTGQRIDEALEFSKRQAVEDYLKALEEGRQG